MKVIETMHRPPVTADPQTTVAEVARLMERTGVGTVAVVDRGGLVGLVTDRDLVRRVLARDLPSDIRVDAVMSMPVISIDGDSDLHDAYGMFRTHAVRRLAVMRDGDLAGIVSIDDLLVSLVADLGDLARPLTAEILFGHHESAVPMTVPSSR